MTREGGRPDPQAILARVQREEREGKRGRLRIYLGAFPGVGKTFAMLNEAGRRKTYGEDVVVGFVETHGRRATASQVAGLEVLPRRQVRYRGVVVEELDVDAVLARRPAVCLVDELAHTNAPGSVREKRYEDVQVILDAGIDVVTTLNVQHLESLNETVASLTGVAVRETIPDHVVDDADEIILIDLSPEAARARMRHGHIYPPAQAEAALEHFFRPANLAALRELALRRTADEVDEQLEEWMRETGREQAGVEEHVLVYARGTPFDRTLVRRGWRLAQGFRGDLLVAYLKRERGEQEQVELARTIELAEDLNARVIALDGADETAALGAFVAPDETAALGAFAVAEGVQHVVLGHEPRGWIGSLLRPSLADRLLTANPALEVHLAAERGE
jgi:two-component system sensor histidine kinase KdpD